MASVLSALRRGGRAEEAGGGDGGAGYALVDAGQWSQLVNVVNTLSRNQGALAERYRELAARAEELRRNIDELRQVVANMQSMVLTASERLTAAVISQVLQVATSRALEGIAANVTVNLEPLQRLLEERLSALEAAAAERDRRIAELLDQVGARLSDLSSAAARLAENLDKLGRGQASLADSIRKAMERLEAALSNLAPAGGADLASRLDAVASDVKTLQAQVRGLSEQVASLSRSLRSLKEELAEELAGEEEEGRGR